MFEISVHLSDLSETGHWFPSLSGVAGDTGWPQEPCFLRLATEKSPESEVV